jgi:hypothetical protein
VDGDGLADMVGCSGENARTTIAEDNVKSDQPHGEAHFPHPASLYLLLRCNEPLGDALAASEVSRTFELMHKM